MASAVTFTVDAYPGEKFLGTVGQVRLNAQMTQNVVTYTVVVNTDNSSGKLLPYLTANLQFELARQTGVLIVPSLALKWKPQPQAVAPDVRAAPAAKAAHHDAARKQAEADVVARVESPPADKAGQQAAGKPGPPESRGRVWIVDGKYVRPLNVSVGLSDGNDSVIRGQGVQEEVEVVTGEIRHNAGDAGGTSNPFRPRSSPARNRDAAAGGVI